MADDDGPGLAVFLHVTDGRLDAPPPAGPVDGWTFQGHDIRRRAGETDSDLKARAIAEVKSMLRPMAAPVFFPIVAAAGTPERA